MASSFLPIYGDATDLYELTTGEDIRTGEKMPFWQRGITAGATIVPFISAKSARLTLKGLVKTSEATEQIVKHGDEVAEGAGKAVKNFKPQNLMDELAESGVKYSADDVIIVTKTPDGKLMWLEKGNDVSGLKHIMDGHATDFANRGINDVSGFLNRVLQKTPVKTGVNKVGPFADYLIDGKMYKVAYGTNGYIVSFFPID